MIRKWMPQSDILAHKNVVLFISHGGMFGTTEGVYRGKPMLFIPFYGDQYRNALRSEKGGYGLILKYNELNLDTFYSKITELVTNLSYRQRATELSERFRDNLVPPMEEAMYWIEYVARHKGAPHLKSHAVNMPWYSYLLLDIFALAVAVVVLPTVVIVVLVKRLFRKKPAEMKSPKNKRH